MSSPPPTIPPPQLAVSSSTDESELDALFEEPEDVVASTYLPVAVAGSSSPRADDAASTQGSQPKSTKFTPTAEQWKELQDFHAGLTRVYPAFMDELLSKELEKERSSAPAVEQPQPRDTPEAPGHTHPPTPGHTPLAPAQAPVVLTMEALHAQKTAQSPPHPEPRGPPAPAFGRIAPTKKNDPSLPSSSYVSVLKTIPMYDYQIPGDPTKEPVNFTAVEIIALLPQWYQNYWVANRLLSNGIRAGTHQEILRKFRSEAEEQSKDYHIDGIRRCYLQTMRGAGFGSPTNLASFTLASHRAPQNWKPFDISVNKFLPDRLVRSDRFVPPSVPFLKLFVGVSRLPEGPDAADLTRALKFVHQNPKKMVGGQAYHWMFPDDLQFILNKIGRTQVTQAHSDGEVVKRYPGKKNPPPRARTQAPAQNPKNTSNNSKNHPQARNVGPATPIARAQQNRAVNAASNRVRSQAHNFGASAPTTNSPQNTHQVQQNRVGNIAIGQAYSQAHDFAPSLPTAALPQNAYQFQQSHGESTVNSLYPHTGYQGQQNCAVSEATYQALTSFHRTESNSQRPYRVHPATDHVTPSRKRPLPEDMQDLPAEKRRTSTNSTPTTTNSPAQQASAVKPSQDPSLIRNCPVPAPGDMTENAQVIRFTQRPLQRLYNWRWDVDHVTTIINTVEREYLNTLNQLLNVPPHNKSLLIRELGYVTDVKVSKKLFEFVKRGVQLGIDWRYDAHHLRILENADCTQPHWTLEKFSAVLDSFEVCGPECKAVVS